MNTDERQFRPTSAQETRFDELTERIIGCAYRVGNALGPGFSESVYENALVHEMNKEGLECKTQEPVIVWYDNVKVGEFKVDILVNGVILIELKAVRALDEAHRAQCINYLTATRLPVCLLINFSSRVEVKRIAGPSLRQA